ncbi:hypothetical protein Dimus_022074 [Dionaea muscipula]
MKDNGLNNVMELIKRQKWEKLFKRREFVFIDAVKEFYAKITVIHLKKKDVVKSSVKGVAIEFNHDRLASILGVPGKNGICEYIKDVWEELKYMKPLEITRRRRDDVVNAPEEEDEEEGGNRVEFDREAVIDEAAVEGESRSDEQFYDAQVDVEEPRMRLQLLRKWLLKLRLDRRKQEDRESTLVSHLVEFRSDDEQITSRV